MEVGTLSCALPSQSLHFFNRRLISSQAVGKTRPHFRCQTHRFRFATATRCLKRETEGSSFLVLNKFQKPIMDAIDSFLAGGLDSDPNSSVPVTSYDGVEPIHGKSGSSTFYGITYSLVGEEGELEYAPLEKDGSSYFWLLAPAAFISSLILGKYIVGSVVRAFFKDVILVDIMSSFSSEALFYIGLATFFHVADRVQRPYLKYSVKTWGLITGLKGYLYSAIFTMGLKIIAPLVLLYLTWSTIRLEASVAIAPFLVGCVVQFAFERYLNQQGSSCWPLVPIIFEVYRMYQVTKAANFAERLIFAMDGLPSTPELRARSGALFVMMVTLQLLGMVCLWSLMTFLVRLFPSRPVADNY